MTAALRTECANWRSAHFATREDAEGEVLTRKLHEARARRSTPSIRHVEACASCEMWMIVSPEQRANRRGAAPSPRRR